ncbi:phage/plasmid primase, P4 family [Aureimonas sp. Leaf324]|uniref:DNA primase family protein n=1 Tax=Aureimonas sp. Leaf324 TaxID=1736336 RepID=UPI000B1A5E7A|nr:phage/plasmid primase, P4 family [Aureimonas sp. Leaf324]
MTDRLQEGVSLLALCAGEDETDIGNGNRFCHRYGDDVRFVTHIGFHVFDSLRWREDEGREMGGKHVRPLAHRTAEAIRFECAEIVADDAQLLLVEAGNDAEAEMDRIGPPKKDEAAEVHRQWKLLKEAVQRRDDIGKGIDEARSRRASYCRSSQNSGKLDNMLKEAAPYLSCTIDEMNTDPLALNCRNGTVRFAKFEDQESDPDDPRFRWHARLDPHRREDLISKLFEADVLAAPAPSQEGPARPDIAIPSDRLMDAEALLRIAHKAAPNFIEFIHRMQPDLDMRDYLRRVFGYMLTGLTGEQVIFFFYGIGANGKSTMTDVIGRMMSDYSVTLGIESFTGDARRGGADATPDLARLNGAYACFASEGDESARLKEGLIKLLTGDDKIAVRKLHQDFVEIQIKAKFVITGNHKPIIRGDDDGIWRRVHLIEWPVQIPREERDKDLPAKLLAERDGIFAWMLAGALEFLTLGGLHPPAAVLAAVQEHREESDPISAYIRGGCEVSGDESDQVTPGELYEGYVLFCRREGLTPFGASTFNRRLPDKSKMAWKSPDGRMRQFVRTKSGATVYRGIRIQSAFRPGSGSDWPSGRDAPLD